MDKLQMCRICLAENVHMYVVVNKTLHDLYEKLTDNTFVTEDSRPILACFICCAQLKKCYRFQKKCLESENQFAKMMNEEFERKPLINKNQFELFHGFTRTPIDTISIVDVDQTESIVVKEELPADCERLDDVIEPEKEYNNDLKKIHPFNYVELEIPSHHSKSQAEHDVSSVEIKIEFEEEQKVSETKRRVEKSERSTIMKKPKLTVRRTEQEDYLEMSKKPQSCTSIPVAKEDTFTIKETVCRTTSKKDVKCEKRRIKDKIDDNTPFKCDLCQRTFANKYNLSIHNCIKPGEKPYKCDTCKSSFAHKGDLKNHTRIHTGEKPYKCDTCESCFVHKGDLLKHNRIHTGEKPYKCNICQYSFSQKGHLSKHIRIHTGEKPYNCNVCQRSFSRKDVLTSHIRMHLGEKPFKCDTCQMNFGYKCDLTKHVRIHTGEKPYKCNICQFSFRYKSTLTKHSLIHTG